MNLIKYKSTFKKLINFTPYLFLLFITIFIWKLNQLTPLWADDFCRIQNSTGILEAIQKAVDRYFTLNGRFFVHIINYLVLGNFPASISYFNVINSLFFMGLILLIFYIAFDRKPKGLRDALYILFIFNLIFVGVSGIGEVVLWKSGSIGYLWAVVLELVFLLPFFRLLRGRKPPSLSGFWFWGYCLISFVASTFLEHLSFAVSAFFVYIFLVEHLRRNPIPDFLKASGILHVIGSVTLILSKGNILKASYQDIPPINESILTHFSFVEPIVKGGLGWILIFSLILALGSRTFIATLKSSIIWPIFSLAALSLLVFVFLPADQPFIFRIAFPFEMFMILGIVYLSGFLPKVAIFEATVFLILAINILGHGLTAYKNSTMINEQIMQRDTMITTLRARGEDTIELGKITLPYIDYESEYVSKYVYISDVTRDPSDWRNGCFAASWHLKEVRLEP